MKRAFEMRNKHRKKTLYKGLAIRRDWPLRLARVNFIFAGRTSIYVTSLASFCRISTTYHPTMEETRKKNILGMVPQTTNASFGFSPSLAGFARLIQACGFQPIPFDLGILREKGRRMEIREGLYRFFFSPKGEDGEGGQYTRAQESFYYRSSFFRPVCGRLSA